MDDRPQAKPSNSPEDQIQDLRHSLRQLLHPTEGVFAKIQEVKAETEVGNLRLLTTVDMVELRLTEYKKYLSDLVDVVRKRVQDVEKESEDSQKQIVVLETKVDQLGEAKKVRRGFLYGGTIAVVLWVVEALLGPLQELWALIFAVAQ